MSQEISGETREAGLQMHYGGGSLKDIREDALLYDFYGGLLKGRQKEIFEASVMEDLSLSEISEEQGISLH